MRTSIEYLRDRSERFLSCRVPYLQLQYFVLYADQVGAELDADRHIMIFLELVFDQSLQDTRFTDA